MKAIKVLGTGSYVPPKVLSNFDLEKMVETNDQWITTRTGIKERRISDGETTLDLAYKASKKAVDNSGVDPEEIGLIIVATISADNFTPSTACLLQERLGLNDTQVMSFDISAACSGFVYALDIARGLLHSLKKPYCLIVGSEVLSKMVDFTDRGTCILFGDGAGAAVITLSDGLYVSYQDAKGDWEALNCPALQGEEQVPMHLAMAGTEVFKFAVETVPKAIEAVLKEAKITLEQVDHVICHQANERIIRNVMKRLKSNEETFFMNIDKYGNTSAGSIPLALDEMNQKGQLKKGEKIILVGFGGGLTWGAVLLEW